MTAERVRVKFLIAKMQTHEGIAGFGSRFRPAKATSFQTIYLPDNRAFMAQHLNVFPWLYRPLFEGLIIGEKNEMTQKSFVLLAYFWFGFH